MLEDSSQLDRIAGQTIIQFTDIEPTKLKVEAIVEEQDTNFLLGNSPVEMDAVENYPALVQQMEQQVREIPGNVIVKQSTPKRFIAIVYDVDHSPICEEVWIKEVFEEIISQCYTYKVNTLAMPLLGAMYSKLTNDSIIELLQNVLINNQHQKPKKILIYKKQVY